MGADVGDLPPAGDCLQSPIGRTGLAHRHRTPGSEYCRPRRRGCHHKYPASFYSQSGPLSLPDGPSAKHGWADVFAKIAQIVMQLAPLGDCCAITCRATDIRRPRHYHPKPASAAQFGADPPAHADKTALVAMHKSRWDEPAASGTSPGPQRSAGSRL